MVGRRCDFEHGIDALEQRRKLGIEVGTLNYVRGRAWACTYRKREPWFRKLSRKPERDTLLRLPPSLPLSVSDTEQSPLSCMGDEGRCDHPIPLPVIR